MNTETNVTLELYLTRTVTVEVWNGGQDYLNQVVQQLSGPRQEQIHSIKIVEVNGRNVGTSLDGGSALEQPKQSPTAKLGQLVPALLERLRRNTKKKVTGLDQITKPVSAPVERESHEKTWQAMDWARQAGHNVLRRGSFVGKYKDDRH